MPPPSPTTAPPAHHPSSASLILFIAATVAALAAVAWLLATNQSSAKWAQAYNPTGTWQISTAIAALPILVLLGALAILRVKAHIAALAGLVTALAVAILIFHMPVRLAFTAASYGAGYGLFPICWIVLPVIFLYDLTVHTGLFVTLQQSLANITPDSRLQLLLIAFALGAFFEGTCGFGTPVAVCGAILISLGFRPLQAAALTLLADTAPVAFGGLGIPIVALHGVTGLDTFALSKTIAVLLAPFCVLIPFWLIWAFAGFTAMLEVWPAALIAGVTFAVVQCLVAILAGPSLSDIAASTATIVALVVFLRFWRPRRILSPTGHDISHLTHQRFEHDPRRIFHAWLPWLVLSVLVFAWGIPAFSSWMDTHTTIKLAIPGLNQIVQRTPPVVPKPTAETAIFAFNWLTATGTSIFIAAIIAGLLMGLKPTTLVSHFLRTLVNIRFTLVTIAAMLAIGYVTRYCGLDATLGLAFARTGSLYPFFGTLVGWLGTASTGSDTSSNVLFGSLQTMTARQLHISPILMASANTSGGVMGKMVAAPSVVVATTATQTYGQEGAVLRRVLGHSLAFAALVGILVYLMAYVPPFTHLVAH
ncbi:MAG: L-lactate permease [Terracidiphilus sp.]|jgi:lactate permease